MITNILKFIKNLPALNALLRSVAKRLVIFSQRFSYMAKISGNFQLTVDDLTFNWYSKGDDGVADELYYNRFEEDVDILLFKFLSNYSKVIFDVGANTGVFAVVSAKENPSCQVFAFEPFLSNYNRLVKNVELNNLKNVKSEMKALGDKSDVLDFYVPMNESITTVSSVNLDYTSRKSHESTRKGTQIDFKKIKVPQITLDEYVRDKNLTSLELIKIDVETYEIEVFKGAMETLKKFKPLIITEIFLDEKRKLFFTNYFEELGYHCYLILKSGLVRIDGDIIPNYDTMNYLFSTRKSSDVYTSFNRGHEYIKDEVFAHL